MFDDPARTLHAAIGVLWVTHEVRLWFATQWCRVSPTMIHNNIRNDLKREAR